MTLKITSVEALDAAVAEVVQLKIHHTQALASKEAEVAAIEKKHQEWIQTLADEIAMKEAEILDYCQALRPSLFADRKSRETPLAVFGFEWTPHRVEPASRKIKWRDVVARLLRLDWGKAYVRQPEPQPDKQALLTDREKLSPEQLGAAGIEFLQDEQFFIRPKATTAEATVKEAAA